MDVGMSEVSAVSEKKSIENDKPFFKDSERADKYEIPRGVFPDNSETNAERYYDSERSSEFDVPQGLDDLRLPEAADDVTCSEVEPVTDTDGLDPPGGVVETWSEGNESNENDDPEYYEDGTRDLTDEEWESVKEKTGWSDDKRKKCTIDEDGVIHYKTDRCDLEGKTAECGVSYERKTIEYNGIVIEGVFPVFDSAFDTNLPPEKYQTRDYACECNARLKEAVQNDPELRSKFTSEQLKDIEEGRTPRGYVWHHSEEPGKMQLVKKEDHDRTVGGAAHTGGSTLWGPDSADKKVKGETF